MIAKFKPKTRVQVTNPARGTYGQRGEVVRTIYGTVLVNIDWTGGYQYEEDELEEVTEE